MGITRSQECTDGKKKAALVISDNRSQNTLVCRSTLDLKGLTQNTLKDKLDQSKELVALENADNLMYNSKGPIATRRLHLIVAWVL